MIYPCSPVRKWSAFPAVSVEQTRPKKKPFSDGKRLPSRRWMSMYEVMGHAFPKPQATGSNPVGATDDNWLEAQAAKPHGDTNPVHKRRCRPCAIYRLWQRVDRSGAPGACWPWRGALTIDGYGRVFFERRDSQVHRLVYLLSGRRIHPGQVVMHSCDNRMCANPAHLSAGSIADNVHDMIRKGRQAKGSRMSHAKLTEDAVRAIRLAFANGRTRYQLAAEHGVSHTQICFIVKRIRWKHVA